MIIDFHTHCFPDALAPRAIGKLLMSSDGVNYTDGTAGGLIEKLDEWGIDAAVVCNIATNPHQMSKVNDFAVALNGKEGKLFSLGSVNPDAERKAVEEEFKKLAAAGIPGIKIHPDFQLRMLDDPCYDKVFECAIKYGMFVLSHTGIDRVSPDKIHATPDAVLNVIGRYPEMRFVAAHMGGKQIWDEVEEKLIGKDIMLDTAVISLCGIGKERAERMIRTHGADKVLFGSDCPWSDSRREADFILSLDLSDGEKEAILHKNAEKMLHLT